MNDKNETINCRESLRKRKKKKKENLQQHILSFVRHERKLHQSINVRHLHDR